jgi:hypothetical protein
MGFVRKRDRLTAQRLWRRFNTTASAAKTTLNRLAVLGAPHVPKIPVLSVCLFAAAASGRPKRCPCRYPRAFICPDRAAAD